MLISQHSLLKFTARDRDRTGTGVTPQDFKSCASANSATRAHFNLRCFSRSINIPNQTKFVNRFFYFFSKSFSALKKSGEISLLFHLWCNRIRLGHFLCLRRKMSAAQCPCQPIFSIPADYFSICRSAFIIVIIRIHDYQTIIPTNPKKITA